jgi:single-strand DNA-binding protein
MSTTNTNVVILNGRLVRDVELIYTSGGMAITNGSIAVNRKRKSENGIIDEVSYFDFSLMGKIAENLRPYMNKGKLLTIQGRLKQDRWQGQNGEHFSKVKIIAENVELLGGNNNANSNNNYNNGYDNGGYDNGGYDNSGYDNSGYDNNGNIPSF